MASRGAQRMKIRQELLELTHQALITLSNAGFVKRGLKELEAGKIPTLEQQEDGTLIAHYADGNHTRLAPETALKEAECSCPATGMCRHRVMLVLTYQHLYNAQATTSPEPTAERWQPGQWIDELESLPATTRQRASMLASQGLIIELSCPAGDVPSAKLPMSDVRFFSRHSMRFARCDCVEGTLCEHVILAVQAFAAAEAFHPEFERITWQLQTKKSKASADDNPFATQAGQQCVSSIETLFQHLWKEGMSQPPAAFERIQLKALRAAQQLEWRWVVAQLQQLKENIHAFQHRASHYNAAHCLSMCAELSARLISAQHMAQQAAEGQLPAQHWRTIVGQGIDSESQLDHLRLISLGVQSWQDQEHYGAKLWFIDPDTGNLLHISREWPLKEQQSTPIGTRRIANTPIATLAGGQLVAQGARRTAKGELKLEARGRRTGTAPLSQTSWDMPQVSHCPATLAALRTHLAQQLPSFVRPWHHADNLFIVPATTCQHLHWNAAQQQMEALLTDSDGDHLYLKLPSQPSAPHAVDIMVQLLESAEETPLHKVSGYIGLRDGHLEMEPLMIMTEEKAWPLHALPISQTKPLPIASNHETMTPAAEQLMKCQMQLVQWLHNGVRFQSQHSLNDMLEQASRLEEYGYEGLALLLRQLCRQITQGEDDTWPATLMSTILLRDALEQGT